MGRGKEILQTKPELCFPSDSTHFQPRLPGRWETRRPGNSEFQGTLQEQLRHLRQAFNKEMKLFVCLKALDRNASHFKTQAC